jgi:hypothetical protein
LIHSILNCGRNWRLARSKGNGQLPTKTSRGESVGDSQGSRRYPCELSSETGRCNAGRRARPGWSFPPFARQTVASGGRAWRPIARSATQDAPSTRGTPPSQTASVCRTEAR